MSYPQDNVQWTQMPLQNATQYQQQITGFINPPQPQSQMQVGLLPQAPPQQLPQNVYDNLALQQQTLYNQPQQMQAQNYNQQPSSQHPPPFMGHAVRQSESTACQLMSVLVALTRMEPETASGIMGQWYVLSCLCRESCS